jgi:hypothetical protein
MSKKTSQPATFFPLRRDELLFALATALSPYLLAWLLISVGAQA